MLHELKEWWYSPGYFGGFVRDPDGNDVEAVHLAGAVGGERYRTRARDLAADAGQLRRAAVTID